MDATVVCAVVRCEHYELCIRSKTEKFCINTETWCLKTEEFCITNDQFCSENRQLAFDVNVRGCYNAIRAAVAAGHTRFVNSGPLASLVGHRVGGPFHHQMREEISPQPGAVHFH